MVVDYAKGQLDIDIIVIDISPRWRKVHDIARWKRVLGGGLQVIRDIFIFVWILAIKRPQVVHLTTPGSMAVLRDVAVLFISRLLGVPSIYHIRFGRAPFLIQQVHGLEALLFKLACKLASHVVAIDKLTYDSLLDLKLANCPTLIPNCYNPSSLPVTIGTSKRVIFIGWIIPAKGVEDLIEAWRQIVAQDWELVFVGPGDPAYVNELKSRAMGFDIEFIGEVDHGIAMNLLSSSDILVLPSHTEGFPNVVLEGMALGKPVLATSVGAIPEMLADNAGVVVPPKNVIQLAFALQDLIDSPARRFDIGEMAKSRATSHYSLNSVFLAYRSLWFKAVTLPI